jgi:D-tyrosyl-tRNA(Tyr) deacylase
MRILLQKVSRASVSVDNAVAGSIGTGYVLLVGVLQGDTEAQAAALAEKIMKLRLFEGENGKINDRSLLDVQGEALVISQFTLAGETAKGNRPDYTAAEKPERAAQLYRFLIAELEKQGIRTASGTFGAHMQVELVNDGPVTLMLER